MSDANYFPAFPQGTQHHEAAQPKSVPKLHIFDPVSRAALWGLLWSDSSTGRRVALREITPSKATLSGGIRHSPFSASDHKVVKDNLGRRPMAPLSLFFERSWPLKAGSIITMILGLVRAEALVGISLTMYVCMWEKFFFLCIDILISPVTVT